MGTMRGRDGGVGALAAGQFISPVMSQLRQDDLLLTELRQPGGCRLPWHEHEVAYVTVVLDGHYAEATAQSRTELPRFSAIFNPTGVAHSSSVGTTGMRLFTIECSPRWLARLDLRLPAHPVVDPGAGSLLWPGLSLFSRFKTRTADRLLFESHLVEMFGAVAGDGRRDSKAVPPWFGRLKEQLHAQLGDSLTIRDLAAEAGVHPVHLARVFRQQEGQTPGDYVQRLRVRAACERLRDPEATLAATAADCGFADQSHMTRVFKRLVGATPGAFRRAMAPPA